MSHTELERVAVLSAIALTLGMFAMPARWYPVFLVAVLGLYFVVVSQ